MVLADLIRMGLPGIAREGAAARRRDLERLFEVTQGGRRMHGADYEDVVEQFAREDFERVLNAEPWRTLYSLPVLRDVDQWLRKTFRIKTAEEVFREVNWTASIRHAASTAEVLREREANQRRTLLTGRGKL